MRFQLALAHALGLALIAHATTGCNADDCYRIAESGDLGAFLVGGSGLAKAYLVCDSLRPPAVGPQGLTETGGVCAPAANDDACLTCVKASCCEAAVQCVGEPSCGCMIACRTGGDAEARCVTEVCDAASIDAAYDTAVSCVTKNCSVECPRLRP